MASEETKNDAARKITSVFYIALAKKFLAERATVTYARYWEPSWACDYYFNEKTGASFWEKPKFLRHEVIPYADAESAALAEEAAALARKAAEPKVKVPTTRKEILAAMKEKNPKAGECLLIQPHKGEYLKSSLAVWGLEAVLVQVRCLALEAPYRMSYAWGDDQEPDASLRVFVFDREIPGTTKFELRTDTGPDRGGILSTFSRNRAVADMLEWPVGLEFYAYFASRPGTTLFTVSYSHSPLRSIITTSGSVGAVWTRHFTFHGFEGTLFQVREAPEGDRYCVALPHNMLEWDFLFSFVGFVKAVPGSMKISVFERHDPVHRFKISPAAAAARGGWFLLFSFYAFSVPMPGTKKFAVQQRREPDECRVSDRMALPPWKDLFVFYAYDP